MALLVFGFLKNRRRAALRAAPMPDEWRTILHRNLRYYRLLDEEDRHALEALVRIFIAEKRFEGCGGLTLTDEMKVTIAGQACLLLLHRETDVYPDLVSILVYPHAYQTHTERHDGPVVIESEDVRLGESWSRGTLVLAWDHVDASTRRATGANVVLHEFAHQLDAEEGAMDGAPELETVERYRSWARVVGEEYKSLSERLLSGHSSDIDPYGATNPSEFFAVLTEMFFERPERLRKRHPELYAELASFYKQDPAALIERAAAADGGSAGFG